MQVASRIQENILLRRPPVSRVSSSQEGLTDLISNPAMRGKVSPSTNGIDICTLLIHVFVFLRDGLGKSDIFLIRVLLLV